MKYDSTLKSPKKEEQEVPETEASGGIDTNMDELQGIFEINEDEEYFCKNENEFGFFSWDFMDCDETANFGEYNNQYEEERRSCSFNIVEEEKGHYYNMDNKVIKRETSVGIDDDDDDDDDDKRVLSLNLNLNYQEVLDAWSDRGPLWANDYSLSMATNGYYMGEVPVMEEERTRREASVLRYKEKRQTRLFSKKIRYQVRKLNADRRPRLKGRFVKRGSLKGT